jgi:8-oxo-dGTP pyrophosphatase MutT (NUDIX family)
VAEAAGPKPTAATAVERLAASPLAAYTAAVDPGDELVDIVDDDDRVVGTVTRREMRRRGLLHRCTYVLIRNGSGEILVHRRTDTKDVHPGAYDVFAGGVCAAGESYEECARREIAEEFGVVGVDLRFLFRHRYRGPGGQAWGAVYEGRWEGAVRHQDSEVAWSGWVAPDRLRAMLQALEFCPDSREILGRMSVC